MRSIYEFTDYRDFLVEQYKVHKVSNPSLNLDQFAKRIGLGHSNLKMILTRKRKLGVKNFLKVVRTLNLSETEKNYFEALVLKDSIVDKSEKKLYLSKANKIKSEAQFEVKTITNKVTLHDELLLPILVYISDQLIDLKLNDKDWARTISEVFSISNTRADGIIKLIKSEDLIQQKDNQTNIHYSYSFLNHKLGQINFLKKWLVRSSVEIEKKYEDPLSLFTSSTVAIDKNQIPQFKQDLKKVIEKYISKDVSDKGQYELVQTNIQMYKITK